MARQSKSENVQTLEPQTQTQTQTEPQKEQQTDARAVRFNLLFIYAKYRALIRAAVNMARAEKLGILEYAPRVLSAEAVSVVAQIDAAKTMTNNLFGADDCRAAGEKGAVLIGKTVANWAMAVLRDGPTMAQIDSASVAVAKAHKS